MEPDPETQPLATLLKNLRDRAFAQAHNVTLDGLCEEIDGAFIAQCAAWWIQADHYPNLRPGYLACIRDLKEDAVPPPAKGRVTAIQLGQPYVLGLDGTLIRPGEGAGDVLRAAGEAPGVVYSFGLGGGAEDPGHFSKAVGGPRTDRELLGEAAESLAKASQQIRELVESQAVLQKQAETTIEVAARVSRENTRLRAQCLEISAALTASTEAAVVVEQIARWVQELDLGLVGMAEQVAADIRAGKFVGAKDGQS